MRRGLCLSIFLLAVIDVSFAQEKILLNVRYDFIYVRDLENKAEPYRENMILSLGKQSSRYCSERLYNEKEASAAREKELEKRRQVLSSRPTIVVNGGPLLLVSNQGTIINEEITKDSSGGKLLLQGILGFKSYKIETAIPKIDWVIQTERRIVGGYSCQKAVGVFGGRTFYAWFAPDLPFHSGPWKLSGLPGLILEASDKDSELCFIFKDLTRNTDPGETTHPFLNPDNSIPTDLKAYCRIKAEFDRNPESVMTALAPDARLAVRNIDDPHAKTVKKIKQYNPMELK